MAASSSTRLIKAPPNAIAFGLRRCLTTGDRGKKAKVTGDPLPDGTVPDRWDAAEFSPERVLALFGAGQYRVEWYDAENNRISSQLFTVANPAPRAPKLERAERPRARSRSARAGDDDPDDEDRPRREDRGDTMTLREFLAMQAEQRREDERREERNEQRRRDEFAAAQQRDREFMATILGALVHTRAAPEQSSDLLRRELSLEIRQGLSQIRSELGDLEPEEPEDERDPPADLGEGLARVGGAVLSDLEQRAPHLVSELIPQIGDWLKQRGFAPSPEVAAQMARQVTNGRGHAGQS